MFDLAEKNTALWTSTRTRNTIKIIQSATKQMLALPFLSVISSENFSQNDFFYPFITRLRFSFSRSKHYTRPQTLVSIQEKLLFIYLFYKHGAKTQALRFCFEIWPDICATMARRFGYEILTWWSWKLQFGKTHIIIMKVMLPFFTRSVRPLLI